MALDLVEVTRLPRREERDEREPREDEEGVHHPVGHHPFGLVALGRVMRERDARGGEREEQNDEQRVEASHCCPGTVGRMFFCQSGGSFAPRSATASPSCR